MLVDCCMISRRRGVAAKRSPSFCHQCIVVGAEDDDADDDDANDDNADDDDADDDDDDADNDDVDDGVPVMSDGDERSPAKTKATSLRFLFGPPISSRRRRTCCRMISLAASDFENPARIIAPGTLTPVVVWRTRTAESTFF